MPFSSGSGYRDIYRTYVAQLCTDLQWLTSDQSNTTDSWSVTHTTVIRLTRMSHQCWNFMQIEVQRRKNNNDIIINYLNMITSHLEEWWYHELNVTQLRTLQWWHHDIINGHLLRHISCLNFVYNSNLLTLWCNGRKPRLVKMLV